MSQPSNVTIEIDTHHCVELLNDIAREIGFGFPELLKNEVRLLMLECIRKTPPKTKSQGEQAVTNDLRNAIPCIVQQGFLDRVGSLWGINDINHWITFSDGHRERLVWKVLDATGSRMAAWHQSKRNLYGRVPKSVAKGQGQRDGTDGTNWFADYVVADTDYKAYLEKTKKRVGYMKSGWVKGLEAANEGTNGVQQFVTRHQSNKWGNAYSDLNNHGKPSVAIINFAPGIRNMSRIVSHAMATRGYALSRRLRRAISGIRDDVVMGRRISKIRVDQVNE